MVYEKNVKHGWFCPVSLYNNETQKNARTLLKKCQAVENIELKF